MFSRHEIFFLPVRSRKETSVTSQVLPVVALSSNGPENVAPWAFNGANLIATASFFGNHLLLFPIQYVCERNDAK